MSTTPEENQDETRGNTTNDAVGRAIGLSESAVSRIRGGNRYPGTAALKRIASVYSWPISDQMELMADTGYDSRYSDEFNRRIAAKDRGDRKHGTRND